MIALVFSVLILGFALACQSLIDMWLRQADASQKVYEYCSLLLIGTAFNAVYNVGYMDWVVRRKVKNILALNLFSMVSLITLLPISINNYGAKGAAFGWVFVNLIGFCFSLGWVRTKKL